MNDRRTPSRFIFLAIAIALMMPVVGIVVAQEPLPVRGESVKVVKVGEYRDLTFRRELKLAAAPYVNPGLAKTAEVAYKYDMNTVMKAVKKQAMPQFLEALNTGVAVFAVCDRDSQTCIVLRIHEIIPDERALADYMAKSGSRDALVSTSGQLLGKIDPLTRLVSWRPQEPVTVSRGSWFTEGE